MLCEKCGSENTDVIDEGKNETSHEGVYEVITFYKCFDCGHIFHDSNVDID